MPLRNVATSFTIEQQRLEINALAGDVNNIATGVTNVGTAATAIALAAGATGADLTLSGTLTVNGTQTILNTATLEVEDKNIVIAKGSTTDAAASGGGITLKGANDKTISYSQTGDKWVANKNFEAPNLAYTSGDQTFSGNLTIQKGSADNADLMIGATGTGEARIYLDASNGDFSGGDYGYFKQTDDGLLKIGNMNSGGVQFIVGEGAGGAGNALSIINNGNCGIGNSNPNWPLTVQRSSGTTTIGCKNTGGNASVYIEASDGNTAKLELVEAGTGSYSLQVGNDNALMFFDDSTERLRIDSSGNATFTENINLAEGKKTIFGSNSGTGAYIKHQSGHLEIKNETGNCYWDNIGGIRIRTGANYDTAININTDQSTTFEKIQIQTNSNTPILEFQGASNNQVGKIDSDALSPTTSQMRFYIEEGGNLAEKAAIKSDGVYDSIGNLRRIPLQDESGGAYVLVASDAGQCVHAHGSTTQITVNQSVFSAGDAVSIVNGDASDLTITQGSSFNLRNSGDGSTGDRTLSQFGMATIYFSGHNVGYISGAGLS